MITEIYIGTSQCDYEDELNVDYSISNIKNLTGRNIPKTFAIKLPWTPTNIEIFKFTNEINVFIEITDTGSINFDGSEYLGNGKVRVLDVVDKEYIKITISQKGWIDTLSGVKIADLTWTDDDHTYNKATIDASEDPDTTGKNYLYPLINYGEWEISQIGTTPVKIDERFAAVKGLGVLENIFTYCGYTLTSTFKDSAAFKRLYLLYTKSRKIYTTEFANEREFRADLIESDSHSQIFEDGVAPIPVVMFGGENNQIIPFADDSTDPSFDTGGNYTIATYKYTCDGTGSYRFVSKVQISYDIPDHLDLIDNSIKIEIIKDSGGETVLATDTDSTTLITNAKGGTIYLEADTGYQYITTGFDIFVRITLTGTAGNAAGPKYTYSINLIDTVETYFYNKVGLWYANGQSITFSNMLPDIFCMDYLKGIIHLFNLVFFTDVLQKTIYMEERDSFYTSEVIDWTDKIDRSEKVTQAMISNNYSNNMQFKYKNDSNDVLVSEWEANNNDFVDGYLHTFDSQYTKEGVKPNENPVFAATFLDIAWDIGVHSDNIPTLIGTGESFIPKIMNYDYDSVNSGPTDLTAGSYDFEGDTRSTYVKMNALDYKDLYDYYFNDIEMIDKGKIITAYVILDSNEYQKFMTVVNDTTKEGFRPIYKIDINDTISYCRINRIVTNGKKTKVEFIKIKHQE